MTRERAPLFETHQQVYFDMLDLLGILHNAAFILLFERGRTDFWRALFSASELRTSADWPVLVARNEINYHAPITGAIEVRVAVFVSAIGQTSVTFGQEVYLPDGTLSADGRTVMVHVDPQTRRPAPWSDGFRTAIAPHLRPERQMKPIN